MSILGKNDITLKLSDLYYIGVGFVRGVKSAHTYIEGFESWENAGGPTCAAIQTNRTSLCEQLEARIGALESWGEEYENIKQILKSMVKPYFLSAGVWNCRKDTDLDGNFLGLLVELRTMVPEPGQEHPLHERVIYTHIHKKQYEYSGSKSE